MSRRSSALAALAALGLAGCGAHTAATQGMQAISSLEPVETWMQDRGPEGNAIVFRNNTRQQIRITSVQLLQCQNTSPSCGTLHPNVVLDPGQTRDGMIVRPFDRQQGFSFTYQYNWDYIQPAPAAPPISAANSGRPAPAAAPPPGPALPILRAEDAHALGARFAGIRVRADSVVIQLGRSFDLSNLEIQALDSAGHPLGRLVYFDAAVPNGAVVSSRPGWVMAVMAGEEMVTFRVPSSAWPNDPKPRPEARVRFVVR